MSDVYDRIERRLRDDLQFRDDDVAGVLELLREELDPAEYVLEQWACDRCGENQSTASKGGEDLCNPCIFGREPIDDSPDSDLSKWGGL